MAGKVSKITPEEAVTYLKHLDLTTRILIEGEVPSDSMVPGRDLGKIDKINVPRADPREAIKYINSNFNEAMSGVSAVSGMVREVQGTYTEEGDTRILYFELLQEENVIQHLKFTYRPGQAKPKKGWLQRLWDC